ncbi:tyrosine-type recombinase/integrase [Nocardia cyriacigeorgica]|nr:tyrosine-type recombinase/integrase [Nocardia cyriacigeorgica]
MAFSPIRRSSASAGSTPAIRQAVRRVRAARRRMGRSYPRHDGDDSCPQFIHFGDGAVLLGEARQLAQIISGPSRADMPGINQSGRTEGSGLLGIAGGHRERRQFDPGNGTGPYIGTRVPVHGGPETLPGFAGEPTLYSEVEQRVASIAGVLCGVVVRHPRRIILRRGLAEDITAHSFRHAVATILDDAGLSARITADVLGHADPAMAQRHYMARGRTHHAAAAALDQAVASASRAAN